MEPEQQQSSKPSRARRSSPSKKKAAGRNVRHMFYVSGFSALVTFALTSQSSDLSVVSSLCRLIPVLTSSGEITHTLTP